MRNAMWRELHRGVGVSTQTADSCNFAALTYLRAVRNRFSDNKDVYDTFLEIMKEFKAQRWERGSGIAVRNRIGLVEIGC